MALPSECAGAVPRCCVLYSYTRGIHEGRQKQSRLLESNAGLLTKILIVWFLVSFGAGILFADVLNNIKLGGYPLGFWFAHQGSIYILIALIFYYAKKMGDIDRQFDVHED